MQFGGSPKCAKCGKPAYAAERVMGPARQIYHKPCLTCTACSKRLDSLSLVEHDGLPFCKHCHGMKFGTRDLRSGNVFGKGEERFGRVGGSAAASSGSGGQGAGQSGTMGGASEGSSARGAGLGEGGGSQHRPLSTNSAAPSTTHTNPLQPNPTLPPPPTLPSTNPTPFPSSLTTRRPLPNPPPKPSTLSHNSTTSSSQPAYTYSNPNAYAFSSPPITSPRPPPTNEKKGVGMYRPGGSFGSSSAAAGPVAGVGTTLGMAGVERGGSGKRTMGDSGREEEQTNEPIYKRPRSNAHHTYQSSHVDRFPPSTPDVSPKPDSHLKPKPSGRSTSMRPKASSGRRYPESLKPGLHHGNPYFDNPPDFARLAEQYASFRPFVTKSDTGHTSINFKDPSALRELTRLLLLRDFNLEVDLPTSRLCPTLPNRLDYLSRVLELVPFVDQGIDHNTGAGLRVLDIGTGASAIYPILLCRLKEQARVTATELDEESLNFATRTIERNGLAHQDGKDFGTIKLLRASEGKILFPLRDEDARPHPYTFTMCNPPFFSSEADMTASAELKTLPAHASPTASFNELMTPGGEVAFISQMMTESTEEEMQDRCAWFTSLVGKAGSLAGLVAKLGDLGVDNYFLMSIRQAQTSRWILGWSHGDFRLPDDLTRQATSSTAKHLPQPNRFTYCPPNGDASDARAAALKALAIAGLPSTSIAARITPGRAMSSLPASEAKKDRSDSDSGASRTEEDTGDIEGWTLAPRTVTWSRAARRQAQHSPTEAGASAAGPPLFVCQLSVIKASESPPAESPGCPTVGDCVIEMNWVKGRDRATVNAFWTFLVRKIGDTYKEMA